MIHRVPFGTSIPQLQITLPPQHLSYARHRIFSALTPSQPPSLPTENHVSPHIVTVSSGLSNPQVVARSPDISVSNSTLVPVVNGSMMMGASTSAASVAMNTQPSLIFPHAPEFSKEPSGPDPLLSFPQSLDFTDFSSSTVHRPPPLNTTLSDSEIYNCIITPYSVDAFKSMLNQAHLSHSYSVLVDNLKNGFPIGDMPPLSETIIIPNPSSIIDHLDKVYEYINTELAANRMSGPYSQAETEHILRGPFYCSPFAVVIQSQGPNTPPKTRI